MNCVNCSAVNQFHHNVILWRCHACRCLNCKECQINHDPACDLVRMSRSSSADKSSRQAKLHAKSTVNIPRRPEVAAPRNALMNSKSLGQLPSRYGFCGFCKQNYAKSYWNQHIITKKHNENEANFEVEALTAAIEREIEEDGENDKNKFLKQLELIPVNKIKN